MAALPTGLPTVVAHMGSTMLEVRDNSTYPLQLDRMRDQDLIPITEPCRFIYDGPGGFTLPPTTFVSLSTDAATVDGITVSPHLDPLAFEPAIALLREVHATIQAAGWTPSYQGMVGIEELRVRVRDPKENDQAKWPCMELDRGSTELVLTVKRLARASVLEGLFGGGDAFLVNLGINDLELSRRLTKASGVLHDEDPESAYRPVDLVPYLARIRQLMAVP